MSSQNNEDAIIKDFFGDTVGKFLDIGAYDGETFSNTHALAGRGWSGVCVEASPQCFVLLQKAYKSNPNVKVVCAAATPQDGLVLFYDSGGAVASLSKQHYEKWKDDQSDFQEIYVAGISPVTLLRDLPGPYDFLSIDIEGRSVAALNLFPHPRLLCTKLICIEVNSHEVEEMNGLVRDWGLQKIDQVEENWFLEVV